EAAGDYNHDGRQDLVVGNTQGYIYLYLHTASAGTTFQPGVLLGHLEQIRLTAATMDVNDDGWDDVIITYASGNICKFVNIAQQGAASFASPVIMNLPAFSLAQPLTYVGDWNGDGDKDMMISVFGILRFLERSFIDHGYITAQMVGSQSSFGFTCHTTWA